ncbi:hypothetical protein D3C71_1820250 [compost metagenome]
MVNQSVWHQVADVEVFQRFVESARCLFIQNAAEVEFGKHQVGFDIHNRTGSRVVVIDIGEQTHYQLFLFKVFTENNVFQQWINVDFDWQLCDTGVFHSSSGGG